MKIIRMMFLLSVLPAAHVFANDDIRISSVSAITLGVNNVGYTQVSVKADVCNDGERGKVYATIGGYDSNGFELASVMFSGVVMEPQECRTLSNTDYIPSTLYGNIRAWKTKESAKYRIR